MIAMALALRPQVMVMDEPTTALDVLIQREILDEISELRRQFGFSVIFITHDLPLLLEISDRIAIMLAGEVVELDTPEAIYRGAQHEYTRRLLSSFPSLTGDRGAFLRAAVA
jgi:peptide/nickel transport system ATP-binding protein